MPEEETKQVTPEQTTTAAPVPASPPSFRELKVVIVMKGESAMLGVLTTDCDPVYTTITGDLTAALQRVPTLVDEAKKKWTTSRLYPKANLPEPPPTPAPTRHTTPSGKSGKATAAAASQEKKTPSFF